MFYKMNYLNSVIIILTFIITFSLITGQQVPRSPCPDIFLYYQQPNGDIFGKITIPYDGSADLELAINASMRGHYTDTGASRIQIRLATPQTDFIDQRAKTIRYNVFFPFQHSIPRITNIELNGKKRCSGPPEKMISGLAGVSSLWAEHKFSFIIPDTISGLAPTNTIFPDDNEEDVEQTEPPSSSKPETSSQPPTFSEPDIIPAVIIPTFPTVTQTQSSDDNGNAEPAFPSRNQNEACGIGKNIIVQLIYGGTRIPDGTFPWLTAMFVSTGTRYEYKCTANLISQKHVITAARCVNYYKIQTVKTDQIVFIFGKVDLKNWATMGAVTRGASQIETHPEFNQDSGHGDVSVITLNQPLEFSETISPICLWSGNDDLADVVGKQGTIAGWGADEDAQKANKFSTTMANALDMPIVSQDDCLFSNLTYYTLTSDMTFCAGDRKGAGVCVGDNGAGFMIHKNGQFYLRGLASISLADKDGKCDLSYFMIFCDVAKITDWIKSAMTH